MGSLRKECSGLSARAAQLQQDNVGLFERIKFLQHYQRDSKASQLQQPPANNLRHQVRARWSCVLSSGLASSLPKKSSLAFPVLSPVDTRLFCMGWEPNFHPTLDISVFPWSPLMGRGKYERCSIPQVILRDLDAPRTYSLVRAGQAGGDCGRND